MTGSVMKLNSAVQRLDGTFPELLQGLIDLSQLSKDATGPRARLAQLVRHDFNEYIGEVGEIVERLEYLNNNLSRLITAAKKIMEDKQIEKFG